MSATVLPGALPSAQSAQLESIIVDAVERHWPTAAAGRLRALVLAGSLARWEGSWLPQARGSVLLGDAELIYVLPDVAPLPRPDAVAELMTHIHRGLDAAGLTADVSLTPARGSYFRTLPPHIFGYELRQTGRVLWGDAGCLADIPACTAQDLPREDAWRLLCNRLVELLPSLWPAAPMAPSIYPWVKLYLDMATSYLVFAGNYAPSYRERAQRLQRGSRGGWATPDFIRLVETCTAWKLDPAGAAATPEGEIRARALDFAQRLWCWELEQMTGAPVGTARPELWRLWLARQPWRARLRGWASAVRHGGAGPRLASRWLRLALRASPRHCIYEAAAELAFNPHPDLRACAASLPFPTVPAAADPAHLAGAVLDNFHRLAQSTRA